MPWILAAVLAGVFGYAFAWRARSRSLGTALVALTSLLAIVPLLKLVALRLRTFNEWDFMGFWLVGHAALQRQNFYDPSVLRAWAAPFAVSAGFRREIIDVGFWYPPATALLFAPLGLTGLHPALTAWYAVLVIAAGADIYLAWRLFLRAEGALGLVAVAALLFALPGISEALNYAQTSFIALFCLLLFWPKWRARGGSAWLALALFIKPFLAVALVYQLLRRYWNAAVGTLVAVALLSLAALLLFGPQTTFAFLGQRHATPPSIVYSEPTNQSLSALWLRHTAAGTAHVLALISSMTIFLLSIVVTVNVPAERDEIGLALWLPAILLMYPVTQIFYGAMLLVPLLVLWKYRVNMPFGAAGVAAVYALNALCSQQSDGLIAAAFLDWLLLVAVCGGLARSARSGERALPATNGA